MANWHYINKDGEKITVTSKELKQLALQGTITPETIVETEEGKTAPARKVKGLTFAGTTQPESMPSAETYSLANDSLAEKNVQKSTVNYFYTDENGIKSGQINKQRLQTLIDRGTFTSSTQLETDTGQQITVGEIPELNFNNVAPPPVATLSSASNPASTPPKRSRKRTIAYGCLYAFLAYLVIGIIIGAIIGPPDPANTQTKRTLTPEEEREKRKREGWEKVDKLLQMEHERQLQREQQLINSYGSELNR